MVAVQDVFLTHRTRRVSLLAAGHPVVFYSKLSGKPGQELEALAVCAITIVAVQTNSTKEARPSCKISQSLNIRILTAGSFTAKALHKLPNKESNLIHETTLSCQFPFPCFFP